MHLGLDAASAVISAPVSPDRAADSNSQISFAPRLICEQTRTTVSNDDCGGGAELGLSSKSDDGLSNAEFQLIMDRPVRQAPLQTTQPYRENVRQAQGLATHLNPLRQIPNRLPLCNCSRSSRYLLVRSPDPSDHD